MAASFDRERSVVTKHLPERLPGGRARRGQLQILHIAESDSHGGLLQPRCHHPVSLPFVESLQRHAGPHLGLRERLPAKHSPIQGICELRNQSGVASHGAGEPRPDAWKAVPALLRRRSRGRRSSAFTCHRVHRQDRMPPPSPRTPARRQRPQVQRPRGRELRAASRVFRAWSFGAQPTVAAPDRSPRPTAIHRAIRTLT